MTESPWLKSKEYLAYKWYVVLSGVAEVQGESTWAKSFEYWLWMIAVEYGSTATSWHMPANYWLFQIYQLIAATPVIVVSGQVQWQKPVEYWAALIYVEYASTTIDGWHKSIEYWLYQLSQNVPPSSWWLASGVTPIAAYNAKGALSLADSYINRVNPGVLDIVEGVAPTFNTLTGWIFDGATQYLLTGLMPSQAWTVICKYNLSAAGTIFGCLDTGTGGFFLIQPGSVSTYWGFSGVQAVNNPAHLIGNYGTASYTPYRDGLAEPNTVPVGAGMSLIQLYLGALNVDNVPTQFVTGVVSSHVAFSSTLTAPQYLLQANAMP